MFKRFDCDGNPRHAIGFTLIELLVVIAIIGLLASIILTSVYNAREQSKRVTAVATVKELQEALEIYVTDTGFYPPDVVRGWDPGLAKPLPYDAADATQDCNVNQSLCVCGQALSCDGGSTLPSGFPSNWISVVQGQWRGPYIVKWPLSTPWGGYYDYNYWSVPTVRNGCTVPPGIYLGIESSAGFTLDPAVEQTIYNEGLDNDGCPQNGEVQMLLTPL